MNQNQKVIIRTINAGVHYGVLKERPRDDEVILTDTRRIWYWSGAASLSELALHGVSRPQQCKFTVILPEITLRGVIEIIPCSEKAISIIEKVPEWRG